MTLIKQITIECLDCGWSKTFDDGMKDYDDTLSIEVCPSCLARVAEKV